MIQLKKLIGSNLFGSLTDKTHEQRERYEINNVSEWNKNKINNLVSDKNISLYICFTP